MSPSARLAGASAHLTRLLPAVDLSAQVGRLDDSALLELLSVAAEGRDAIDLVVAAASAEVAVRSARELGYDGLAQRQGHRNAVSLVQNVTGQSRGDAARAVRTGEELAEVDASATAGTEPPTQAAPPGPSWLTLLRSALSSGRLGAAQFHAIRTGIGEPPVERYPELDPAFLPEAWAHAVELLLDEATSLPVEELRTAARIARDRLDPAGVTLRFEERFEARSFRAWIDQSGQQHARIAFDDEAAAWVHSLLRAAMRPRRGPRFVGAVSKELAAAGASDRRSNEQLQYDTLMAVLRTGASADPDQAFGDRQPGVRIIVEAAAVTGAGARGAMRVTGVGHVEDGGHALPGGVIEKFLCDAGAVPILRTSHGRPLDVGREQRLFTRKQRMAIAARDGGCLWPGCVAPPSECEYHHIDHWWEDHGRTDVDDGVPLCRNCHMRLHNQGWRVTRERDPGDGRDLYRLHAPPDARTGMIADPIVLSSKSPHRFAAA